jgi:hypothetical protein
MLIMRFNGKKEILLASVLFIFLSSVFVFPLLPHFMRGIPYTHCPAKDYETVRNSQGDHFQFLYHLSLFGKAMQGKIPLFSNGYEFDTPYKKFSFNAYTPPQGQLFYLFSPLGYAGAYNALIFLSLLTALFSAFFYFRRIGLGTIGAFAGALVFGFFPYRIASLYGGHPAGMMTAYIPLFLLMLENAYIKKKSFYSFLAGLFLLCLVDAEMHYLYFLFFFIPLYAAYMVIRERAAGISLSAGKMEDFILFPFRGGGKAILSHINAFAALCIFSLYYLARRQHLELPVILLTVLFCAALFYLISFIAYALYLFLLGKDTECSFHAAALRRSWIFSIFYLYCLQAYIEVKHLGVILCALFLLAYYGSFLIFRESRKGRFPPLEKISGAFLMEGRKVLRCFWPLFLCMALAASGMMYIKKKSFDSSSISRGRELSEVFLFSPGLSDIAKPVNGDAAKYVYPGMFAASAGMISLMLFFAALRRKRQLEKTDVSFFFFLPVFLLSYMLSFGPNISMPPLYGFVRKAVPFFSFIRSPIKMILFSALSLAFLVGMLPAFLKRKTAFYLALMFIFIEYLYCCRLGITFLPDRNNRVLQSLKDGKKSGKVLYVPLWPGDSSWTSRYQIYSIMTDRYMVNGYNPVVNQEYIHNIFYPLYMVNMGRMARSDWSLLSSLGVTDVVLDRSAFPRKVSPFPFDFSLSGLKSSPLLTMEDSDDYLYLFGLAKQPVAGMIKKTKDITSGYGVLIEGEWYDRSEGLVAPVKCEKASLERAAKLSGDGKASLSYERAFPEGSYKGFVRLKASGTGAGGLSIGWSLSAAQGERHILHRQPLSQHDAPVKEQFLDIPLSFTLKESADVLFTFEKEGKGAVTIDYFYIIFADQEDPKLVVEPEDGIYAGALIRDGGEQAVMIGDNEKSPRTALFAPNRLYKKGSYSAIFRIKGSWGGDKCTAAVLSVTDSYGNRVYAERNVPSDELKEGMWKEFSVAFAIDKDSIINFKVHYMGRGVLSAGKIIVETR